ncbi:MAG: hypothetical protein EA357_06520 [Micavibrio sp.]|nr:MAG: hypothetical protein EA357_06520 [Micavibrio sp.]
MPVTVKHSRSFEAVMGMDLALTSEEELLIISDEPFPADVLRVEYYADTQLMIMFFNDGREDSDGMLLDHEIPEEFIPHIGAAATIYVAYYNESGEAVNVYKVPLIQLGTF